jgi:hypothetical protein
MSRNKTPIRHLSEDAPPQSDASGAIDLRDGPVAGDYLGRDQADDAPPIDVSRALVPTVIIPAGRCVARPGTTLAFSPTSLDLGTREGAVAAFNARSGKRIGVGPEGYAEIDLWDWIALASVGDGTDGQPAGPYSWLVLIDAAGGMIGTSSPTVANQLADLWDMIEAGVLERPIRVRISEQRSKKRGQVYHSLSIVEGE